MAAITAICFIIYNAPNFTLVAPWRIYLLQQATGAFFGAYLLQIEIQYSVVEEVAKKKKYFTSVGENKRRRGFSHEHSPTSFLKKKQKETRVKKQESRIKK